MAEKKKTTKKATKKAPVPEDELDKFFKKGAPTKIEIINYINPIIVRRTREFLIEGGTMKELIAQVKESCSASIMGAHKKYKYILSVLKEMERVAEKAKKGDKLSKMKLFNWRFMVKAVKE